LEQASIVGARLLAVHQQRASLLIPATGTARWSCPIAVEPRAIEKHWAFGVPFPTLAFNVFDGAGTPRRTRPRRASVCALTSSASRDLDVYIRLSAKFDSSERRCLPDEFLLAGKFDRHENADSFGFQ